MKVQIPFFLLITIILVGGVFCYLFFFPPEKLKEANTHTEQYYRDSVQQPQRDTVVKIKYFKTHEQKINVDSIIKNVFGLGFDKGMDSLKNYIAWIAFPVDTAITFDTVGVVKVNYVPDTHDLKIGLKPAATKKDSVVIIDSIYVEVGHKKTISDYALELSGVLIFYKLIQFIASIF